MNLGRHGSSSTPTETKAASPKLPTPGIELMKEL